MLMPDFLDSPTSLQSCLNNFTESLSLIAYNSKFSFYFLRLSQLDPAPLSLFHIEWFTIDCWFCCDTCFPDIVWFSIGNFLSFVGLFFHCVFWQLPMRDEWTLNVAHRSWRVCWQACRRKACRTILFLALDGAARESEHEVDEGYEAPKPTGVKAGAARRGGRLPVITGGYSGATEVSTYDRVIRFEWSPVHVDAVRDCSRDDVWHNPIQCLRSATTTTGRAPNKRHASVTTRIHDGRKVQQTIKNSQWKPHKIQKTSKYRNWISSR